MKNNCTYFQRNWGNTVKSGDFLWKQAALNIGPDHTGDFPRGVGHRVENGWGLTKVAVVLLNDLIW